MPASEINTILFNASPCATMVLDVDGKVLEANREARKALALDAERLIGAPVLGTVVEDDRRRVREFFVRVLEGQEREWTCRFRRGDGVTRVQRVRAVPVMVDGTAVRIVVFSRDVTESRSGRPETLQLQTLLENLPGQMVFVLDEAGRIRYSSGLSRTHYRSDVDAVGTAFVDLLDPGHDNRPLAEEMVREVVSREDWAGTLWHRRVDGTPFPVRTYASPYLDPKNGRVLGVLVCGRDVSAEYSYRRRAEDAERMAGIGRVVASIARELDDGLADIDAGLAKLAAGEPRAGPQLRRDVDRIHAFAGSLREFAESVQIQGRRVNPVEVVTGVFEEVSFRAAKLGVTLEVDRPDRLDPVYADPEQFRRVLTLVLDNALEALPQGGEVRAAFSTAPEGVVIRVSDTGPGIAESDLEAIFNPFHTDKSGHTGLGLAVARGILAAHGGRIWAEPGDGGRGLVMALELPFRAPEARLRFRPIPLSLTRTRSVLVVDDEDPVRTSLRRFLEKVGFEVREAWSGRSALAQLTTGRFPEAILTDLKMSDGSGYWFLERLARDYPDLLRRTVVITGDTDYQEVARITRERGCPVIRKPVEPPQLLELLDEVAVPA